jgi:hypothetical protein
VASCETTNLVSSKEVSSETGYFLLINRVRLTNIHFTFWTFTTDMSTRERPAYCILGCIYWRLFPLPHVDMYARRTGVRNSYQHNPA